MILDHLLNLSLHLWCYVTAGDLFEEGTLRGVEMFPEFSFPLGDLVDGDGIQLGDGVSIIQVVYK